MTVEERVELVRGYLRRGMTILGADPEDKTPVQPWANGDRHWKEYQDRELTREERVALKAWVEAGRDICVILRGVAVLDLDHPDAVAWWREALGDAWESIPRSTSPSGHPHLYFECGPEIRNAPLGHNAAGDYLGDVRAHGGQVLVPVGNEGRAWAVPLPESLDDLPSFEEIVGPLAKRWDEEAGARLNGGGRGAPLDEPPPVGEDSGRNVWLASKVGHWCKKFDCEADVLENAKAWNLGKLDPPLPDHEVAKMVASIWAKEQAKTPESAGPASEDLRDLPGHEALDNVRDFVRRFVAMTEIQATAVALWAAHTHAIEHADTTLYLHITSAQPRSGKSRLEEVLYLLAHNPVTSANMTPAVMFRLVEEGHTLLLDEVDAVFSAQRSGDTTEALRGILNAGYRRGNYAHRAQPTGSSVVLLKFHVFGAKALAGIGELPDTIADRSARIHLHRATAGEQVERMRRRDVEAEAAIIRGELAKWVESNEGLADARPDLPADLNDRLADAWEPMLAIADAAGGAWPATARAAAVALAQEAQADAEEPLGTTLLRDVRDVFDGRGLGRGQDALFSRDLVNALQQLEDSPWGYKNQDVDTHRLSRMLKPFGIAPRTIRDGAAKAKGYRRSQFHDAWERYLGDTGPAQQTLDE